MVENTANARRNEMTNQQIMETAKSKGFNAKIEKGRVIISLQTRKISLMEVDAIIDLPRKCITSHYAGVAVYGSDS